MTDGTMALIELIQQDAYSDFVREMLEFAAERMMDLEIEAKPGAPGGARSPERFNHRNGYSGRGWNTRVGRIELAILRKVSYCHSFIEPRRTARRRWRRRSRRLTSMVSRHTGSTIW